MNWYRVEYGFADDKPGMRAVAMVRARDAEGAQDVVCKQVGWTIFGVRRVDGPGAEDVS